MKEKFLSFSFELVDQPEFPKEIKKLYKKTCQVNDISVKLIK